MNAREWRDGVSTTYLGLSHHGGGAQAQIELIDSDPGVMVDIPNYTGTASIEVLKDGDR